MSFLDESSSSYVHRARPGQIRLPRGLRPKKSGQRERARSPPRSSPSALSRARSAAFHLTSVRLSFTSRISFLAVDVEQNLSARDPVDDGCRRPTGSLPPNECEPVYAAWYSLKSKKPACGHSRARLPAWIEKRHHIDSITLQRGVVVGDHEAHAVLCRCSPLTLLGIELRYKVSSSWR
jgi:hypothetical protein